MTSAIPPDHESALGQLPIIEYGTADFRSNSVALFAAASEQGPLCRVLPHDVVGVLRFRDVDEMLRNPAVFSSRVRIVPMPMGGPPIEAMIGDDPPEHTRIRSLFGQVFTPARVAETMEQRVLSLARDLVHRILDSGSEFDLCRDLAVPLPVTVIAQLLGVDERDTSMFAHWSDDATAAALVVASPDGAEKSRRLTEIYRSLHELGAYLAGAIAERQKRPADDLLSFMLNTAHGQERLTEREALSLAMLLLVAGNETTTKLIGLMMNLLLHNPQSLRDLGQSPGLIAGAIEETVRLEGPVSNRLRRTTQACTIAGIDVPANTLVDAVIGAANLDASVFANPTQFDIRRKIPRHLGSAEAFINASARHSPALKPGSCSKNCCSIHRGHRVHRASSARHGVRLSRLRQHTTPVQAPRCSRELGDEERGGTRRRHRQQVRRGARSLPVLEGQIDHRDSVLSEQEHAAGTKILCCVSRGKSKLVLDI